jgi:hypothetical protein
VTARNGHVRASAGNPLRVLELSGNQSYPDAEEARQAFAGHMDRVNADRAARGLPPITAEERTAHWTMYVLGRRDERQAHWLLRAVENTRQMAGVEVALADGVVAR